MFNRLAYLIETDKPHNTHMNKLFVTEVCVCGGGNKGEDTLGRTKATWRKRLGDELFQYLAPPKDHWKSNWIYPHPISWISAFCELYRWSFVGVGLVLLKMLPLPSLL